MKLTKQDILDLNPCHDGLKFAEACGYDAVKIYNTCPRGDWLICLLRRTNTITKLQSVLIAVTCAEHVLCIFEKKYPGDKRAQMAIESVKTWLANHTDENRKECRTTYAAAFAADAFAAAYAADAVASDTARATAYAADAAYEAAAYAPLPVGRPEERQWQADKIREIVPCPFEN